MSRWDPVLRLVLCACSWTGDLTHEAACPKCGRGVTARVTDLRLAALRAVAARQAGLPPIKLAQAMRRWLLRHQLIRPDAYTITEAGREVLSADGARRLEQAKREIVAESVARHAGLP